MLRRPEPGALLGREARRVAGEDGKARVHAVDGHDPAGVVEPEIAAYVAADVPARRAEPRVAEDAHELGPQAGHRDGVQGRADGAVGVPVARHVGHDHVERVGGIGTVPAGVGQQRDDLHVAPERVRPAMTEDQRQDGPGRRDGPGVHEVDPEAAELDAEAGEPGQRRLLGRPVEPVRPVGDELAEVAEIGPERPPGVLGRVRPARRAQPRAEVLQHPRGGLRDERLGAGRDVRHALVPVDGHFHGDPPHGSSILLFGGDSGCRARTGAASAYSANRVAVPASAAGQARCCWRM